MEIYIFEEFLQLTTPGLINFLMHSYKSAIVEVAMVVVVKNVIPCVDI